MTTLASQIRDGVFTRIQNSAMAGKFAVLQKAPPPTFQNSATPALGVFIPREEHEPDGDFNVVPARFVGSATIAVMILCDANDALVAQGVIDTWLDQIQDLILCDGSFYTMADTASGQPLIEGIRRMNRVSDWPELGQRYYSRVTWTMTVGYRLYFEVLKPNELLEIGITTSYAPPGSPTPPNLEVDFQSF